ncbi:DNA adenine methylase [Hydrogenophaga intermedia]|uniref:Phage DNA methylase n=1 Tax=Hydrogenophaga intermedia TaxID=65786 RepID=A0A1L1PIB5_HYDIT|nr:DNA adenine methylase [Hydrogenophaga intermedia]TMU72426.1 DNA adenine methylase [Hydrogenophaga intermedia]CDN87499.1 Phage DNA methylase [Hydrogenophaga intermedia]
MRYQGGKNGAGVFQTIINRAPACTTFVEAFAGSAAIYRRLKPAASSILMERDPEQAAKLAVLARPSTIVRNVDALAELASLLPAMGDGWFVYLDPPYVHQARKDVDLYRFEMSDADHGHLVGSLLPAMTDRGVRWMLSGYRCALYDDASSLREAHQHDFQAMTRRGVATETLWMNYDPAAVALHDVQFAGNDYRDRERIKRKAQRWAAKFSAMGPHEQTAVLQVLQHLHARRWDPTAEGDGEVLQRAGGPTEGVEHEGRFQGA